MKELIERIDFYYSEEGLFVFTEKYHLEKGYCCDMNCRHCPYKKTTEADQSVTSNHGQKENESGKAENN